MKHLRKIYQGETIEDYLERTAYTIGFSDPDEAPIQAANEIRNSLKNQLK